MVQKQNISFGKMEKGRGGRLLLFATQALCALFLLHLLYIEFFTFETTPSQQMKCRQILSEWKADLSSVVVKKDDQKRSLEYLLTRLVGGEDRTKLESTGFACDNTSWSLVCVTNKPVKIDTKTMKIQIQKQSSNENTTTIVRPYAMQDNPYVINDITPVTITTTELSKPTCDHNHQDPVVIFSSGGYTGNIFHEFNENLIPLFITSRFFKSRVHFIIVDYKPSFIRKYRRVFSRLSNHEIINPTVNSSVHCFPAAITGLKFHKFLGINTSEIPQSNYSMPEFREFIRKTYRLKIKSVFDTPNPPKLLLISRQTTRKFLNQHEMMKMMENLGFQVIIASSAKEMSNVEKFSHVINSCSVMVGAHGAGLANEMFLPNGAVMVQVRPLGFQWDVDSFYSEPGPGMGLKYLEYMMQPEESSLVDVYGLDHPVLQNTASVAQKGGYNAARKMYLDDQDLRLDLSRFRETLVEALRLVGRDPIDVANA
ncbi:alpha-1,3-arabinosyltransferase XAT3-like isoform X2 [Rutidosis leptorrhynchoides]|uniref:alpha-1,3-arabinosyltransferase XAT3-like isoform X2 n=1 Tax=Rutidosis leptorrhynchoides TaxID=125765 RepID=UPI003A99E3D1